MKPNCVCDHCGKEIYKTKNSLENCKKHFCNASCYNSYLKKNSTVLITNCSLCNKRVERSSHQQSSSKTGLFFCGNLCKNRFIAKKRRWLKDDVYSHRKRRNILCDKIKNTCQKCGYNEDKKMLDVHHYDSNHKNNKCENLRVLCSWCHTKHHR